MARIGTLSSISYASRFVNAFDKDDLVKEILLPCSMDPEGDDEDHWAEEGEQPGEGGDDGDESFAAGSAPMGSSEYDAGGASPEEEAFELDVEDVY